jgi:hypothetical protein
MELFLIYVHCNPLCKFFKVWYILCLQIHYKCVFSVLDISQTESFPDQGVYKDENKTLGQIIKCLPNLMSLDISGTNLAGKGKLLELGRE